MNQKVFTLAFILSSCHRSFGYAAGPEGFLMFLGSKQVPGRSGDGATRFISEGDTTHYFVINDGSSRVFYYGTLAGSSGHARFWLLTTPFTAAASIFIMRTVSVIWNHVHISNS